MKRIPRVRNYSEFDKPMVFSSPQVCSGDKKAAFRMACMGTTPPQIARILDLKLAQIEQFVREESRLITKGKAIYREYGEIGLDEASKGLKW